MTTKLRLIASVVLLTSALQAEEKSGKSETAKADPARVAPVAPAKTDVTATPAAKASDEVVTLPAVQVTRSRIRQIDVTIKRIDKLIARERKHLKTTDTDLALNNDKVANKAALFGGYSTSQRIAVASERVRLLESERELLEQMKAPMTRENFLVVEKQIELLRTARRELDIVYR